MQVRRTGTGRKDDIREWKEHNDIPAARCFPWPFRRDHAHMYAIGRSNEENALLGLHFQDRGPDANRAKQRLSGELDISAA